MTLKLEKQTLYLSGQLSVEDAEALLAELLEGRALAVDLQALEHLHCANLQVLMAAKPRISAWPGDADFTQWLQAALA